MAEEIDLEVEVELWGMNCAFKNQEHNGNHQSLIFLVTIHIYCLYVNIKLSQCALLVV